MNTAKRYPLGPLLGLLVFLAIMIGLGMVSARDVANHDAVKIQGKP
jgi:hypothetical protein